MTDVTNALRAGWALDALANFKASTRVDSARDAIIDLLADLLHLAKGRGFDPEQLAQQAFVTMTGEFAQDTSGDMKSVQAQFRNLLPDDGAGLSTRSD